MASDAMKDALANLGGADSSLETVPSSTILMAVFDQRLLCITFLTNANRPSMMFMVRVKRIRVSKRVHPHLGP